MGNRLFVGNLPFDTSEQQLRDLLGTDGRTVSSVKIAMDRDTGRPRGFAFVDMGDDEQAKAAIGALDGKEFGGRALKVNEAMEKPGGRMGGGNHGHGGFGAGGGHGGGFRDQGGRGGFGSRGPTHDNKRGSQRGGGRGGGRGS